MGCWYSRWIGREEMVLRCKARKRYMKQFVKARQSFSAAHSMYLRSLRNVGSALLQFATAENNLYHQHHYNLQPVTSSPTRSLPNPPPPPRPTSWATTSASSSVHPSPSPPPPPIPASSPWDFWDPFMPSSGRSVDEEWEEKTTTVSEVAAAPVTAGVVAPPPAIATAFASGEHTTVVSTKSKDLVEYIQELDDYFLKTANAGGPLSLLLEVPTSTSNDQMSSDKDYSYIKNLSPLLTWASHSSRWNAFGKFCEDPNGNNVVYSSVNVNASHRSTVERLYAWEKKLYKEVKNAEILKLEHEKSTAALRKIETKDTDYFKSEKGKKEVEKLESQMMVAWQAIETTSSEIIKLRESELYPQLLGLVEGLMNTWRSMYEYHQVQMHIVQQLKYLNCIPSMNPTSEIHRQLTLQIELEAQQWHLSFCNLMKAQHDYIQSLTGWLRLSLFQVGNSHPFHKTKQDTEIYSLCEDWQLALNNAPDKVASDGIKSFLAMIHAIVVQQAEEQKHRKRSESTFKELEKKVLELRSLESKYGPYSMPDASGETIVDPVREKRTKVEVLRAKADEEKDNYEKSVIATRAITMKNLQMGLPHLFQAMTGFANVYKQAFESVHAQGESTDDLHVLKKNLH